MSCPARMAFSSWGTTVSSKPSTPGTSDWPAAIALAVLRRISSANGTDSQPEALQVGERPGKVGGRLEGAGRGGRGRIEVLRGAVHGRSLNPGLLGRRRGARLSAVPRGAGAGPGARGHFSGTIHKIIESFQKVRRRSGRGAERRSGALGHPEECRATPEELRRHAPRGCTRVPGHELVGQGARRARQRAVAALGQRDGAAERRRRERDGDAGSRRPAARWRGPRRRRGRRRRRRGRPPSRPPR